MIIAKHLKCTKCSAVHVMENRHTYSYRHVYIREKSGQPIGRRNAERARRKEKRWRGEKKHNAKFKKGTQKVKYRRLNCYRIKNNSNNDMRWRRPRQQHIGGNTNDDDNDGSDAGHDHWRERKKNPPHLTTSAYFLCILQWVFGKLNPDQKKWTRILNEKKKWKNKETVTVQQENYAAQQ